MSIKIPLSHISPEGVTLTFAKPVGEFSILKGLIENGEVPSIAPLQIEVNLTAREGYYDINGLVMTAVGLNCSRCLEPFSYALRQRFSLRFSQEIPRELQPDNEEDLEWTADQIGLIFFQGDEIDIQEAIQEQVVLALPFKPLCRPDCKGLCSKCGTDLNQGACRCGNNGGGSPFDVLKTIKL